MTFIKQKKTRTMRTHFQFFKCVLYFLKTFGSSKYLIILILTLLQIFYDIVSIYTFIYSEQIIIFMFRVIALTNYNRNIRLNDNRVTFCCDFSIGSTKSGQLLIKNSIRGNFGKNFGKVLHLIEFILAYLNLFRCCHATAFIVSM